MKRIILIATLLFALLTTSFAQKTALEQCRNFADTVEVMKYHFEDHKTAWIGKRLSEVIQAYSELLTIKFAADIATSPYIDTQGKSYIQGVGIHHTDRNQNLTAIKTGKPLLCFDIYFANTNITVSDFYKNIPKEAWGVGLLPYMRDFIVRDIKVYVIT